MHRPSSSSMRLMLSVLRESRQAVRSSAGWWPRCWHAWTTSMRLMAVSFCCLSLFVFPIFLSLTHTRPAKHVMVLAATNRPDALDAALRRPGRLDKEIEVGIPTAPERRDIVRVLLRGQACTADEADIARVADAAHGHVGADLAAVCKEAGLLALKRAVQLGESGPVISGGDLWTALHLVRPSAMRELHIEVPTVRWSDIAGQDHTKTQLREAVELPLTHPEAFVRMGIRPPRGILLYGPPGCSKTMLAKALATESGLNFIAVKGPELFSKWVGESERAVREVFRKARAAAPSVVFFDEIDALAVQRGTDGGGGVGDRVLSQLLCEMDGVEARVGVTVVAATNRPDMVDAALLRPGRIDRCIYVGPPDAAARAALFRAQLARMPHEPSVTPELLAGLTEGLSGAEAAAVCREAAMRAMRRDPAGAASVPAEDFAAAAAGVRRSITPDMLAFYRNYQQAHR
eukprot:m.178944 g.178944  ORF g.178944 m.178944 type:complete len:460 (-) comp15364_c0_seq12:119-1498(-)